MQRFLLTILIVSVTATMFGCGDGKTDSAGADSPSKRTEGSSESGDRKEIHNISLASIEGEPVNVKLAQLGIRTSDQISWKNSLADNGATIEPIKASKVLRITPPAGFHGQWNVPFTAIDDNIEGEIRMDFTKIKWIDRPAKTVTQRVWIIEHNGLSIAAPSIDQTLKFVKSDTITRSPWNGFDLEAITASKVDGAIELINPTPRVIERPVIEVNDHLFYSEKALPAFTKQTFRQPLLAEATHSIRYVYARPFMRLKLTGYVKEAPPSAKLNVLTAPETNQFNNVIANHRIIDNRWDTNREFLRWFSQSDCSDTNSGWSVCSNDELIADALLERLARKIDNQYGSLRNSTAYGLAFGVKLALKTHELTGIGANSFYYHETMHNHGFSHATGLTYGWSDHLDWWSKNHPDLQFERSEVVGDPAELVGEVTWRMHEGLPQARIEIHDTLDRDITVQRLIVGTSDPDISSVGFARNMLYVNLADYPSHTNSRLVVNGANDASGQGNLAVLGKYPANMGVKDLAANGLVFIEKTASGEPVSYSPSEAAQYCKAKGMVLGTLFPFRSEDMIDFQSRYLRYGTQVGISAETGEPAAVLVPTTYKTSAVSYVETGAVILCSP